MFEAAPDMRDVLPNSLAAPGVENFDYLKKPVFIELCAGSASLSASVKQLGVDLIPIDHSFNRHVAKRTVVDLDLSFPHAWDILTRILDERIVICVRLGPPCGTCSAARGIPLWDGSEGPPPLRSMEWLLGLPHLRPKDRQRVQAANSLYEQLGKFVEELEHRQIPWTIENPTNSFLWGLPDFAFSMARGIFYDCHACAYGSTRKKLTSFLCSHSVFEDLKLFCHDVAPHDHEEWGYDHEKQWFNTSKEAEYPLALIRECDAFHRSLP